MSLNAKYTFDDFSSIRWVNNLSHFEDRFNPQNNQYFGGKYYHKLMIDTSDDRYDGIHRVVLVNYEIDLVGAFPNDLKVWFVSDKQEIELPSVVENDASNIYYITFFLSKISNAGRLELRSQGITYKYSECVKFVDDQNYIVLHTRNYFDKDGIKWSEKPVHNWIRTTLPAVDLGLTNINPEREIQYLGSQNTPIAIESRNDRSIEYDFIVDGNSRILDGIEVLSGNERGGNDQGGYYLNLIKVTPEGDMDRADSSVNGSIIYLKQRNDDGSNIFIDDDIIFSDLKPIIILLNPLDESTLTEGVDNNTPLVVTYNLPIQLSTNNALQIRIYKDNVLIETLTNTSVVGVSGNVLTIKNSQAYGVGEYRIEIDDNFVLETTFGIFGANGLNDWNFSVQPQRTYNDNYSDVYS